jgi:hypothetical protein
MLPLVGSIYYDTLAAQKESKVQVERMERLRKQLEEERKLMNEERKQHEK